VAKEMLIMKMRMRMIMLIVIWFVDS